MKIDSIDHYAIILLFNSFLYDKNATYKYVPYMPNNKYTNIFYIQLY